MQALEFWKAVTVDRANLLDQLIALLAEHKIRYCVIGGQAVNAYVEPLVSLDLDLVVAVEQIPALESILRRHFDVRSFPHSLNVSVPGSDLRVQIQTDPRYGDFLDRAQARDVLGVTLPVADVEDVLQGKIWAAMDSTRRPTKQMKDLTDIARLLEIRADLAARIPDSLAARLRAMGGAP